MGRFLIITGIIIAFVGLIFLFSDKIPFGKLWGDLNFQKGNLRISIPLMTCILISIILTLIFNFFSRK